MRVADNRVNSVLERYRADLAPHYAEPELRSIVRAVFQDRLGWDTVQIESRKLDHLSESELLKVCGPLERLMAGEPLQYVLGEVPFHGLRLNVGPSVLIPRPETEELVDTIIHATSVMPQRVVDVGTGSGCIALSLKKTWPSATVVGIDSSQDALEQALVNSRLNDLHVDLIPGNVLDPSFVLPPAHLIVSNPPYIPRSEAATLARHVIDHEPHAALFVPDEDPLVFYRAIGRQAMMALQPGGSLWFEVHHRAGGDAVAALQDMGWRDVRLSLDLSGAPRFIHAER